MVVNLAIPDLSKLSNNSLYYAMYRFFIGAGPNKYEEYALVVNFVRLVDLSVLEYQSGRDLIFKFWNTHDSLAMGAMIKAVGHYENCISTLKRAINYLKAIRSHPNMQAKELLPRKISVLHGDIEGRITKMRNAIQHLEGQVRKGNIVEGSPVFLMLEQDCIILGEYTIKYSELSGWISELHSYAKNLFRHFS